MLEEQATAALTETARHSEQQQHEIQLAQARAQHVGQFQAQQQQHSAAMVEAAEQHKQHLLLQEQRHSLIVAEARQQLKDLQVNHYQSVSEIQHQHEQLLSKQLDLQAQLKQELAGHVGALAELQVQLADLQDCLQSERQQSFKVHSSFQLLNALISKPRHVPQKFLILGHCMLLVACPADTMHRYGEWSFEQVGGLCVFLVATPYQVIVGFS